MKALSNERVLDGHNTHFDDYLGRYAKRTTFSLDQRAILKGDDEEVHFSWKH